MKNDKELALEIAALTINMAHARIVDTDGPTGDDYSPIADWELILTEMAGARLLVASDAEMAEWLADDVVVTSAEAHKAAK